MTTFNKKAFKGLPTGIKIRKPRYYYQDFVETYTENTTKDINLTKFEGLEYNFAGGLISFKGKKLWNGLTAPDFEGFLVPYGSGEEYLTTKKGLKYNVVGSPVVVDGVASGFSASNYVTIDTPNLGGADTWEIFAKITTSSDVTSPQYLYQISKAADKNGRFGESFFINTGTVFTNLTFNGSAWASDSDYTSVVNNNYTIEPNTTYYTKFSFDGNCYRLEISKNNIDWDVALEKYTTTKVYSGLTYTRLGSYNNESNYFQGSIDLNESYIKIGSKYVWGKNAESFITVKGCLAENVKIYPTVGATLSAFVKDNEILLDNKDIDKEGYTWAGQYSIPSFTYKPLYKPDFNMVGNVTMNADNSFSGFSGSNYISFDKSFEVGSNNWEAVAKFTTTESFPNLQGIYHFHNALSDSGRYGLIIRMQGSKFNIAVSSGYSWMFNSTGTYTIQPNTTYWVKVSFDGSKYVLSYSLDGETYIEDIVQSSTSLLLSGLDIMVAGTWYSGSSYIEPLLGKLYIADCYWKIGNKVYRPMEVIDPNPSYFP